MVDPRKWTLDEFKYFKKLYLKSAASLTALLVNLPYGMINYFLENTG